MTVIAIIFSGVTITVGGWSSGRGTEPSDYIEIFVKRNLGKEGLT